MGGDYDYGEVWFVEAGGSEAERERTGLYSLSVKRHWMNMWRLQRTRATRISSERQRKRLL